MTQRYADIVSGNATESKTTIKTRRVKSKGAKPKEIREEKLEPVSLGLSAEELEELRKTEAEMDVQEQKFTCIVHKGPIKGNLYLCPHCKTLYCEKCAKALEEKDEKCWACEKEFTFAEPLTPEKEKALRTTKSLIDHYARRLQTLETQNKHRKFDKMKYYEEKEKLMKQLDRYKEQLRKIQN